MRSFLVYTLARFALFAVALGLLYLVGARGLLLVGVALLASGLVSYVVLSRQRDQMSLALSGQLSRLRKVGERFDAQATVEDEADEVRRRQAAQQSSSG